MKPVSSARRLGAASLICAAALLSREASAFPGFFASKKAEPIKTYSTQVAILKKGPDTVVSVMSDYEGPLEGFAMVLMVPADVTLPRVTTLKRDYVDRLDAISAPRFHEYWEQDPCDPGPVEQEWQRNLAVQGSGFLGGGAPPPGADGPKVAKELSIDVKARQKEGEYKFSLLEPGADVVAWLRGKGYVAPEGTAAALSPYAGLKPLIAEVDPRRIELVGGDRAQLSPVRFATTQPFDTLPERIGLLNAPKQQELIVYVLDESARYEAKNYPNLFPPTNIEVDFSVKERMGEFYNALYDIILQKNPGAFLLEYAWPTEGCGEPCATEPLMINELLSLGADVFEERLPLAERKPKPPQPTPEELKALKDSLVGLKPKEKREREQMFKTDRETVVERRGVLARNKYVVSRLHYRFDEKTLPKDPQLGTAAAGAAGGTATPKGEKGEAATEVATGETNKLQTRYNNFHKWVPVIQCPNPDRYRWGKAPRDYRGLRKTWLADDLSRKSHTQIKPAAVVLTPIPSLGLGQTAQAAPLPSASAVQVASAPAAESGKCGCRVPSGRAGGEAFWASFALAVAVMARRTRRRRD